MRSGVFGQYGFVRFRIDGEEIEAFLIPKQLVEAFLQGGGAFAGDLRFGCFT